MNKENLFRKSLSPADGCIHFIAVGGIGMSGLANILIEMGYKISGSDLKSNELVQCLQDKGAIINLEHNACNIKDCSLIVVSSAIKHDNPELLEAKKQNIPVVHRAMLLESLMSGLDGRNKPFSIGVTGTHGKTTTSGMIAFLFEDAGLNSSYSLGGQLPHYNTNSKAGIGTENYFVSELDESDGSIELYTPDISIITNLELDHADFYTDGLEQIYQTFERYVKDLNKNSKIIINTDDNGNLELLGRINHEQIITYSTNPAHPLHKKAVYSAEIVATAPNAKMKVYKNNELLGELILGVPGVHNISNGLAAIATTIECGVDFSTIAATMKKFTGMKRRFQTLGYANGARIIDDYAHHPTEILATLRTAKEIVESTGKGRVVAVFQPHRYTRLFNLWDDFIKAFADAHKVFICDVYSASENPIDGVNSENFTREINYADSVHLPGDLEKIADVLSSEIAKDDIVLTMGAGNITYLGQKIIDRASAEIRLTGKELGEYKDIKELRKLAISYYKQNIQGKTVEHVELGKIRFTGMGLSEFRHFGAKERKLKAVIKLLDLVKTGNYEITPSSFKKNSKFVKYHKLSNFAIIEGKVIEFKIIIGVDRHGNKFYDLIQIKDDKKITPENDRLNQKPGTQESNNNITDFDENFNPEKVK